jgi:hypothetical protein
LPLLFHDGMLEALALGTDTRPVTGTMHEIMASLTGNLIEQPFRAMR